MSFQTLFEYGSYIAIGLIAVGVISYLVYHLFYDGDCDNDGV